MSINYEIRLGGTTFEIESCPVIGLLRQISFSNIHQVLSQRIDGRHVGLVVINELFVFVRWHTRSRLRQKAARRSKRRSQNGVIDREWQLRSFKQLAGLFDLDVRQDTVVKPKQSDLFNKERARDIDLVGHSPIDDLCIDDRFSAAGAVQAQAKRSASPIAKMIGRTCGTRFKRAITFVLGGGRRQKIVGSVRSEAILPPERWKISVDGLVHRPPVLPIERINLERQSQRR